MMNRYTVSKDKYQISVGLIVVMTILLLLVTACQKASVSDDIYNVSSIKISAEQAKDMMADDVLIVDVRTIEEYGEGHVPDATLLPLADIQAGNLESLPNKNQKILLYCRSGNRSGQAAKILVEEGYTSIYDFGGINDWPYEIEQ